MSTNIYLNINNIQSDITNLILLTYKSQIKKINIFTKNMLGININEIFSLSYSVYNTN